jgi:hypothetical protein
VRTVKGRDILREIARERKLKLRVKSLGLYTPNWLLQGLVSSLRLIWKSSELGKKRALSLGSET